MSKFVYKNRFPRNMLFLRIERFRNFLVLGKNLDFEKKIQSLIRPVQQTRWSTQHRARRVMFSQRVPRCSLSSASKSSLEDISRRVGVQRVRRTGRVYYIGTKLNQFKDAGSRTLTVGATWRVNMYNAKLHLIGSGCSVMGITIGFCTRGS